MSDREECAFEESKLLPCAALSDAGEFSGQGTRYQGIKFATMVNYKTTKFSRTLVIAKSGKYGKSGIVMNFCPFCGKDIVPEPSGSEPEVSP